VQVDNSSAPLDGIALDLVLVTGDRNPNHLLGSLTLELPRSVSEDEVLISGTVFLNPPPLAETVLRLISNPSILQHPSNVLVSAGQGVVVFPLIPVNNSDVYGARFVNIEVSADRFLGAAKSLSVKDDDRIAFQVRMPTNLVEGTYNLGEIELLSPVKADLLRFKFKSLPLDVILEQEFFVRPREKPNYFSFFLPDNLLFDGTRTATFIIEGEVAEPIFIPVQVEDDEARTLDLVAPVPEVTPKISILE